MTTTIPLANILLGVFFFTILGLITLCFSVSVIKDWVRTHCRGDDNTSTNVGTTSTGTSPSRARITKSIHRPDRSIQLRRMNSTQQQLIGRVIRSSSSCILESVVPNDVISSKTITDGASSSRSMENTTTMVDFGTEVIELDNNNNNRTSNSSRYDNNTNETSCVICLMEYKVNDSIYRNDPNICHHMFHEECITKWIQQQHYRLKDTNTNTTNTNSNTATIEPECPCCRNPIAITRIQINENDANNNSNNNNDNNIPISTTTTTTTTNTTDASFNAEYVV